MPGCVFADRCPIARDRCVESPPELMPVSEGHMARCFFHEEVPDIPPMAVATQEDAAPVPDEVLLQVSDLVKTYKFSGTEVVAVGGVDVEIKRGEVFGLVGESGSGKTSFAKCVVGLIDVTSGELSFEGMDVSKLAGKRPGEARRRLQMVFQNPDNALNPTHSVRAILRRSLKLLAGVGGRDTQDEQMNELARSVRLEPRHLDVRPSALSGGLKQRVAIARSFAGSPAMVLCDEPTSALDVSVQAAILNLLVDLQRRQGVSYVFISHDLAVVRYVSDSIGVMYLGKLVDVGSAEQVFASPHHPYTEALLSAIPTFDVEESRPRIKLSGVLPSASDVPTGCPFHTRCPRVLGEICRTEAPPWQEDGARHRYRCHIPPAELTELQKTAPVQAEDVVA
jgi:peptide/nickel transport system ATP-binding protein